MPRETKTLKAERYLLEGRVVVAEVTAGRVLAVVRGEGARHRIADLLDHLAERDQRENR